MEVKGIFFDLHGTLLRYGDMEAAWAAWFDALHKTLLQGGGGIDRDTLWEACKGLFSESEPPCADDGLTVYERRLQRLFDGLGLRVDTSLVRRAATATVSAWNRYVTMDAQAEPVLRVLQGRWALALVSNFDHPTHIYSVLRDTGLDAYFPTIVISGEVGVKKPDPAILLRAADAACLNPEDVAYVGDSLEDMQAARDAAMFGVWLEPKTDGLSASRHYEQDPQSPAEDRNPGRIACATIGKLGELLDLFTCP